MATAKRAFSKDDLPVRAADYYGDARCVKVSPNDITAAKRAKPIKRVEIYLTFDEVLRLSLAVQSCAASLNKYDRRKAAVRKMGMCLSIDVVNGRIMVIESKVIRK